MIIEILKIDIKTSAKGAQFGIATVKNEANAEFENVTIFGTFPEFTSLKAGSKVEGDLITNDYNGRKGWKLQGGAPGFKKSTGNNMAKAVEAKQEGIKLAQENKQEAIKVSSTFRDATLLTIEWIKKSDIPFMTKEDVQRQWLEWRAWLLKNFDESAPF